MTERSKAKLAADAWGSLLRVHADLVPAMDRELTAQTGVPLGWYDLLLELAAADDHALTMSQLGERAVLSRTRVSRVVDEMVASGLVERQPHPGDRRSALAVLTVEGERRYREAAPVYLAAIERSVGRALARAELEALAEMLEKVRSAARSG